MTTLSKLERIEYRTLDKAGWPRGVWDDEPDKVQWVDEATGLPCLALRGPVGAWCGYVGITAEHPLFGADYNSVDALGLDVHGGLTFGGSCSHGPEDRSICHVPAPGETDHVWWLGFDCNHCGDFAPGWDHSIRPSVYRDLAYVAAEVTSLAKQLKEYKAK